MAHKSRESWLQNLRAIEQLLAIGQEAQSTAEDLAAEAEASEDGTVSEEEAAHFRAQLEEIARLQAQLGRKAANAKGAIRRLLNGGVDPASDHAGRLDELQARADRLREAWDAADGKPGQDLLDEMDGLYAELRQVRDDSGDSGHDRSRGASDVGRRIDAIVDHLNETDVAVDRRRGERDGSDTGGDVEVGSYERNGHTVRAYSRSRRGAKGDVVYGRFGSRDGEDGGGNDATESDVDEFLADAVEPEDGGTVTVDELEAAFEEWASGRGLGSVDHAVFMRAIDRAGYRSGRIAGATRVIGVRRKSGRRLNGNRPTTAHKLYA